MTDTTPYLRASLMGVADGLATLDGTGNVPLDQLGNAPGGGGGPSGALVPVEVVSFFNTDITSSPPNGGGTIDGATLLNGWRVLLANQSYAPDNGIWIVNTSGDWTRPTDWAHGSTPADGVMIPVAGYPGSNLWNSLWIYYGNIPPYVVDDPSSSPSFDLLVDYTAFQVTPQVGSYPNIVLNGGGSSGYAALSLAGGTAELVSGTSSTTVSAATVVYINGGLQTSSAAGVSIVDNSVTGITIEEQASAAITLSAMAGGTIILEDSENSLTMSPSGVVMSNTAGGSGTVIEDTSTGGIAIKVNGGSGGSFANSVQISTPHSTIEMSDEGLTDLGSLIISNTGSSSFGMTISNQGVYGMHIEQGGNGPLEILNAGGEITIDSTMGGGGIAIGGAAAGQKIGLYQASPVTQPLAISPPTGGATVDTQARAAINSILNAIGQAAGGIGITA